MSRLSSPLGTFLRGDGLDGAPGWRRVGLQGPLLRGRVLVAKKMAYTEARNKIENVVFRGRKKIRRGVY